MPLCDGTPSSIGDALLTMMSKSCSHQAIHQGIDEPAARSPAINDMHVPDVGAVTVNVLVISLSGMVNDYRFPASMPSLKG